MSNFDETVHKAIELAKSITAPDEEIQTVTLLATLIEVSYLKEKFPTLLLIFMYLTCATKQKRVARHPPLFVKFLKTAMKKQIP